MTAPAVFWPALLGLSFLVAGILTYRRDLRPEGAREAFGLVALGPVFVAASLAAFAGEHFTAARSLAALVPKWMPGRLFVAYLVGVAHLAAALSFVARRCVRWAAIFLAVMFALFVLLMDLPGAIRHSTNHLNWTLVAREGTFAMGALALFATRTRPRRPRISNRLAEIVRIWTASVVVFYGIENIVYPRLSPGVPDTRPTSAWVPLPLAIAWGTGILLVAFGVSMFFRRRAGLGAALSGLLMLLLTVVLYVPELFLARGVSGRVEAINFVADTLLFAGTLFLITRAILDADAGRTVPDASSAETRQGVSGSPA